MIRQIVERADRIITYCGLFVILLTMLLTSADALARYLFNSPIEGTLQITEDYLLVLLVFLVLGYSYRTGSHIRVTLLLEHVGGSARIYLGYFAQAFSILCGAALTIATFTQAVNMFRRGSLASGSFNYPLWPAYAAVFLGCLLMTLLMILDLGRIKDGKSGLFGGDDAEEQKSEIV
jgi:TRAP-type C4-dicarboxylate transport system permease small subunit